MFRRLSLIAATAAALVSATSASPASAQVMSDCNSPASTSVFAPWLDPAVYFLAPDGGFEAGGAGWNLRGATVGAGNESYYLSGPGDKSLEVSSGDSATSPEVCVGIEHPTFRFMVRKLSGSPLASMDVKVLTANGTPIPVGTVTGSGDWQPSPVMLIGANMLPLVTGSSSTQVRFRFAGTGDATWQVDDLYVDPWGSR